MDALADRSCHPVPASAGRLSAGAVVGLSAELGEPWRIAGDRLRRTFLFVDFAAAVAFVQAIGAIADAEDHHPDVMLSYGKVIVELWTHTVDGLSESDFIVAAKIERAYQHQPGKKT